MPELINKDEPALSLDRIELRGVRTHNLKNINLDIPHGKLIVITGPSGSGKSSLAFDTIFAEGQRQFIESLSIEARQHFDQIERPDVDLIEGLQPTICIDQRRSSGYPQSTVATLTEIYDHLRLLFSRAGDVHCSQCGKEIRRSSATQVQNWIEALPEGTRLMLLAPMVRESKGDHASVLEDIRKNGFVRIRVNGELHDVDHIEELDSKKKQTIEAIIDRLVVKDGFESRLAESIQHGLKLGNERVVVIHEKMNDGERTWLEETFSTRFACPNCLVEYDEIEPRSFSFNSPYGACQHCNGLGSIIEFDIPSIIPDWHCRLSNAILVWKHLEKSAVTKQTKILDAYLKKQNLSDQPLSLLDESQRTTFLRGDGKKFLGLMNLLEQEFVTATDSDRYEELLRYRGKNTCPVCHGSRLRDESNHVTFCGESMLSLINMTIAQSIHFFKNISLTASKLAVAERIVPEIVRRLEFLQQVGADYLTLGRSITTLSGGEFQRVRLATGIGSGLAGICYILDEPSIGLHERDNQRLIDALKRLQDQGNTLIVVEHDETMMRQAEHLIDMGPKAGSEGGEIIASGTLEEVLANSASETARFLNGTETFATPENSRKIVKSNMLTLSGATANNLKNIDVSIPLNVFTCITGVSGSGKSSLINSTLIPALTRQLGGTAAQCGGFEKLTGVSKIKSIVEIDQAPIGRSPRSNAATYTGLFDDVRKIFAASRQAKQMGFSSARFSFNAKAGRCEVCQGHGVKKVEMSFLPDIQVTCEACNGQRFNRPTLQVKFKGQSIADVLAMSVDEGIEFFENHEKIYLTLQCMHDVGLGYLPLGQTSSSISGGEAQRIKLATNLARTGTENTIYFLDEPTTGLHFVDIKRLLVVLQRLVDKGNSVVVIEHNLEVARQADWIIDLGPGGGAEGGEVIATGPPAEITKCSASYTGQYL